MVDVDIFVGNNAFVDLDVYQLWLNGQSGTVQSGRARGRAVSQWFKLAGPWIDHTRVHRSIPHVSLAITDIFKYVKPST